MFTNCYTFNPEHYGVVQMARTLEQVILEMVAGMPPEVSRLYSLACVCWRCDPFQDIQTVFNNCYAFNQAEDDVSLMCRNVENLVREKLKLMPAEVVLCQRHATRQLTPTPPAHQQAPPPSPLSLSFSLLSLLFLYFSLPLSLCSRGVRGCGVCVWMRRAPVCLCFPWLDQVRGTAV